MSELRQTTTKEGKVSESHPFLNLVLRRLMAQYDRDSSWPDGPPVIECLMRGNFTDPDNGKTYGYKLSIMAPFEDNDEEEDIWEEDE